MRHFALAAAALVLMAADDPGRRGETGCAGCHADASEMTRLGYPRFYITGERAQSESRHPGVACHECHLGDPAATDARQAHRGLLSLILLDPNLNPVEDRARHYPAIRRAGTNRMFAATPKLDEAGERPDRRFATFLYHDRNRETLAYDPAINAKTCGRCHEKQTEQYHRSPMGANLRQREMRGWTPPRGAQNCGPSFADAPPELALSGGAFYRDNWTKLRQGLSTPFTFEQAKTQQKLCNLCHTGCLDCHFEPTAQGATHNFVRKPESISCMGGGRGSFMCHAGTERRRGNFYLGGEFTEPPGIPPDVHADKGVQCVDCHATGPGGMGHLNRAATCGGCHGGIERAHSQSAHRSLTCAACHVTAAGGYQWTTWGPGELLGQRTPFRKYAQYYGLFSPPLLSRDQRGMWTPMKVWGNSVGGIKNPAPPSGGLRFRWPNGETRDAYAELGTPGDALPGGRHLLWLQFDAVSHPLGKSRSCESCHEKPEQVVNVTWEYRDTQGAMPFLGSHTVTATARGIAISEITSRSVMTLLPGARETDFALWRVLPEAFQAPGDYSLPAIPAEKVAALKKTLAAARGMEAHGGHRY